MAEKYLSDPLFMEKARPYIEDPAFLKLRDTQHHNDSVYIHTLRVAFLAYRIGKKRGISGDELLRGALFHDLYFHDWRDKEFIFNHGWSHPVIALENARKLFPPITEKEANIISSHMWPFNFKNPPKSKEAFIVSLADKLVSSGEILLMPIYFVKRLFKRG